jgi:predicted nucleic acid-binding protein
MATERSCKLRFPEGLAIVFTVAENGISKPVRHLKAGHLINGLWQISFQEIHLVDRQRNVAKRVLERLLHSVSLTLNAVEEDAGHGLFVETWRPIVSPALAFEYEAVLKRGTAETGMTLQDIDDFIEYLCSRSRLVQIYFRWRPALPDPNDDRILEVAVRTRASIVTFNTRDFVGTERFGIGVMSPGELLKLIGVVR